MSSRLTPCSRAEFIRKLLNLGYIRKLLNLGYEGPHGGGDHQFMAALGKRAIKIPNPDQGDISVGLLSKILRDASIDLESWLKA